MNKSILLIYVSLAVAPFASILAAPVPIDATPSRSAFPRLDGSGVLASARDIENGVLKDPPYHVPGGPVQLPRDAATGIPVSVRDTETPGNDTWIFVARGMPRADTSEASARDADSPPADLTISPSVRDTETPGDDTWIFVTREMPRADTSILTSEGRSGLINRDMANSAPEGNTRVRSLGTTRD